MLEVVVVFTVINSNSYFFSQLIFTSMPIFPVLGPNFVYLHADITWQRNNLCSNTQ